MTRVNLVPVDELMDQHLFAEFRELKMIPKSLARSIAARGVAGVVTMIPPAYVLGKGHVSFFYNKGFYLAKRYEQICNELKARGIDYNPDSLFDSGSVMAHTPFNNDYIPTAEALAVIRHRIAERIAMKPAWYRKTKT